MRKAKEVAKTAVGTPTAPRLKRAYGSQTWSRWLRRAIEIVTLRLSRGHRKDKQAGERSILNLGSFSMDTCAEFQMVCGECGSLTIKIENPESASRQAIVYCGHCGASRGTMGVLRDLAVRTTPDPLLPRDLGFGPLVTAQKEQKE